jgi:hypothetical protein
MAKVIEFYVPANFQKKAVKWMPPGRYGKVILFRSPKRKSA